MTSAMDQAIDAAVYACRLRGLRATSIDMRDALEAAIPFLVPEGDQTAVARSSYVISGCSYTLTQS